MAIFLVWYNGLPITPLRYPGTLSDDNDDKNPLDSDQTITIGSKQSKFLFEPTIK